MRVELTALVEKSLVDGNISQTIETIQKDFINKEIEKQSNGLLFESKEKIQIGLEFLDLSRELEETKSDEKSDVWLNALRTYTGKDGFYFKISDIEIPYGYRAFEKHSSLAYTRMSKAMRLHYFTTQSKGLATIFEGPAGTGKTETMKDIS